MVEEILYPEEVRESAYESLYLRNFDKDTKRKIQHIAVDEKSSVSKIINRALKAYVKDVKNRYGFEDLVNDVRNEFENNPAKQEKKAR